jgi:hypothetical protein
LPRRNVKYNMVIGIVNKVLTANSQSFTVVALVMHEIQTTYPEKI